MELFVDLLLIFLLRLVGVAIATVRIVLLGRGKKGRPPLSGSQSLSSGCLPSPVSLTGIDDPARMVAFAAGTFLGAKVEEWLALGQSLVRIVAPNESPAVAGLIRDLGFGATVINGSGLEGEVRITFSVIPRRRLSAVVRMVREANPDAYVTIDQTSAIEASSSQDGKA